MTNQNVLAAIIAVFISLILFIAGIIFSSDPYRDSSNDAFVEQDAVSDSVISSDEQCLNLSDSLYQSCCEEWLVNNQLNKTTCVGSWEQTDQSVCSWQCSTE